MPYMVNDVQDDQFPIHCIYCLMQMLVRIYMPVCSNSMLQVHFAHFIYTLYVATCVYNMYVAGTVLYYVE